MIQFFFFLRGEEEQVEGAEVLFTENVRRYPSDQYDTCRRMEYNVDGMIACLEKRKCVRDCPILFATECI